MQKTIIPVQDWFAVIAEKQWDGSVTVEAVRILAATFDVSPSDPDELDIWGQVILPQTYDGMPMLSDEGSLLFAPTQRLLSYVHEKDLPPGIKIRGRWALDEIQSMAEEDLRDLDVSKFYLTDEQVLRMKEREERIREQERARGDNRQLARRVLYENAPEVAEVGEAFAAGEGE